MPASQNTLTSQR